VLRSGLPSPTLYPLAQTSIYATTGNIPRCAHAALCYWRHCEADSRLLLPENEI